MTGEHDLALQKLEELARTAPDVHIRADSMISLAEELRRKDPKRSMSLTEEALALCKAHNYTKGEMHCYTTMGMTSSDAGNYNRALGFYQMALQLCDRIGDTNHESYINGNLGSAYNALGDPQNAKKYIEKALTFHINNKNYKPIHVNYTNLGVLYGNANNLDKARECYEKALEYCALSQHLPSRAINLSNLGTVYARQNDLDTALKCFKEAYDLNLELKHLAKSSTDLINISRVYFEWKDYDKAFGYGKQSEEVAMASGSLSAQMLVYQALSYMFETIKNWEEYARCFKKFYLLEKEVKSEEAQKRGATLEMQRQVDLKEAERHATEKILHNILPKAIAERIKTGDEEIIERYENCSVLFADIVGFTTWSAGMEVKELARHLNKLFQIFDDLANQYGVEKIKTIGDAYMCVAGLPEPCADHAERIAHMALAMQSSIAQAYPQDNIRLRIGIHCGEVIAGVLGKNKYAYDLWGDTVNTASRMESHSIEDKIQVSEAFRNLIAHKFSLHERGEIDIKGKGKMRTWFLIQ